jgi:hypothetical protein
VPSVYPVTATSWLVLHGAASSIRMRARTGPIKAASAPGGVTWSVPASRPWHG